MPGAQPPEMMPQQPQPSIPTTPPGKIAYDPRMTQPQPPQPQPQQQLYMQPYVQNAPPMDPNVAYQMPVQSTMPPPQMTNPYGNAPPN